jgi:hypothetical protein
MFHSDFPVQWGGSGAPSPINGRSIRWSISAASSS